MQHVLIQVLLNAAGIVSAFLLCSTAAALYMVAGPTGAQPLLILLLAGAAAALAHAIRHFLASALVTMLSALPFAAWLVRLALTEGHPGALLSALGLLAAAGAGAAVGYRFRDTRRWRAGHSATALLTLTLVLLIILAPLLLMMPR